MEIYNSYSAYTAYKAGDKNAMWLYAGKAAVDFGFMFVKANPIGFIATTTYSIVDASGGINYIFKTKEY